MKREILVYKERSILMGYRVLGNSFKHEVVDLWKSRVDLLPSSDT